MLPVYREMNQQPHPYSQTSHIPYFPNNYYPNWEVNPQSKPDSIKSPAAYGPWSYGGGFGYPTPMECHGCCSHVYPPGYYTVRPPHSHLPASSPFYYHGPYPPYAEAAYPPYHAPNLYPMQQPRYEYDNNMHGRHCCGCPNHVSDKKEDKGVKIEEFEPEIGKKDIDSLGLAKEGNNNWPYPFLLVPPDYLKKNGDLKPLEIDPKVFNGWYPFGMKNDSESGKPSESESKNRLFLPEVKDVKSLQPIVNDKATQNSIIEDKRAQFPFPAFWFPNYEKLEEQKNKDGKEFDTNASPKLMEEQPEKLKIIPMNVSVNDNHATTPVEDKCDNKGDERKAEKAVKVKNIPVKQIEDRSEKNAAESKSTLKEVHVEQKRENEKKSSGNDVKSQSSSSRKASKLPPVCLRVDPLPRRKTGKCTSKSPSPPASKILAEQNTSNGMQPTVASKECPGHAEQVYLQKIIEEEKAGHHIEADHSGETLKHCKEDIPRNYDEPQSKITVPDVSDKESSLILPADERDLSKRENESDGDGETVTAMEIMEKSKEKKELSTTEAALLIQSFYRGFVVRKWKPLEKLKLIAKVREQATEVREQIHVLESSAEVQKDEKKRVLVAETIMNLLLQLDTIQGLHPSVREIRKAVARELVSMQEKLDSLVTESRREENIHEPRNASDASLLDAICESELQNGCVPAERTDQPKEAEDPYTIKNQLPADGGLEESVVAAPSDSKFETVSHSTLLKDEAPRLEDRGDAEKLDEVFALHAEFANTPVMVDKKEDSEMEELRELMTQTEFCESEGKQSIDVDDALSVTAENEVILLGKDKDAITQGDMYEKSSLEDCTSQSIADGSTPLDSKDQELGSGKDKDDVLDLSSQGQLVVCLPADGKEVEEATALHENNVNSGDEDVLSEPLNLPGIVLLSQESMQRSDDETKDDGSNSPQEGTKVPDVVPSSSERVENLCLDMKANLTEEDCKESKATADGQEVPVNEEVAVRGGTEDKTLKEENEKLREMIDKLIREGKHQLTVISDLNGKVKNLERKLTRRKD